MKKKESCVASLTEAILAPALRIGGPLCLDKAAQSIQNYNFFHNCFFPYPNIIEYLIWLNRIRSTLVKYKSNRCSEFLKCPPIFRAKVATRQISAPSHRWQTAYQGLLHVVESETSCLRPLKGNSEKYSRSFENGGFSSYFPFAECLR
jgi:hypothetical protein